MASCTRSLTHSRCAKYLLLVCASPSIYKSSESIHHTLTPARLKSFNLHNIKMGLDTALSGAWPSQINNEVPTKLWDHATSRKSSISSQHSGASATSAQHAVESAGLTKQPPTAQFSDSLYPRPEPSYPVDPLAREYPKPTQDLDVREALNRKPGKWTLGHYIKETPVRNSQQAHERDPEKIARDMEAKKQELLKAKEQIRALSLPK